MYSYKLCGKLKLECNCYFPLLSETEEVQVGNDQGHNQKDIGLPIMKKKNFGYL